MTATQMFVLLLTLHCNNSFTKKQSPQIVNGFKITGNVTTVNTNEKVYSFISVQNVDTNKPLATRNPYINILYYVIITIKMKIKWYYVLCLFFISEGFTTSAIQVHEDPWNTLTRFVIRY